MTDDQRAKTVAQSPLPTGSVEDIHESRAGCGDAIWRLRAIRSSDRNSAIRKQSGRAADVQLRSAGSTGQVPARRRAARLYAERGEL